MISLNVFKDSNDTYRGFSVVGHANYAENGKDIVCSAVSILSINTINSIENFTNDKFVVNSEDGLITFSFTDNVSKESVLLLDSMILGFKTIKKEFGKKYIQILFKEV